jgi:hypothetical protein
MHDVRFGRKLLVEIQRLQDDRAYRDKSRRFYVEGVRNFLRTNQNRVPIETIVYSEKLLTVPIARQLVRQLRREGVPTVALSPEEFRQISQTRKASGIGLIVRQPWQKLPCYFCRCRFVLGGTGYGTIVGKLRYANSHFGGIWRIGVHSPRFSHRSLFPRYRTRFYGFDFPANFRAYIRVNFAGVGLPA